MRLINDILLDEQLRELENLAHPPEVINTSSNISTYAEDYENYTMEEPTNSFFSLLQLMYLSYMPVCCIVGFTGNCMVWILIRYIFKNS